MLTGEVFHLEQRHALGPPVHLASLGHELPQKNAMCGTGHHLQATITPRLPKSLFVPGRMSVYSIGSITKGMAGHPARHDVLTAGGNISED